MRVFLIEERAMVRKALALAAGPVSEEIALFGHESLTDFAYLLADWKTQVLAISLSYLSQDVAGFFAEYARGEPVPLVGIGTEEEILSWQADARFIGFISRPFAPGDFFRQLQFLVDLQ